MNPLPVLMATASGAPSLEKTRSTRPSPVMSVRLAFDLDEPVDAARPPARP
ncbi:hypothetical protein ACFFQW_11085 [Umezawaea endophytica]|uniref:Uncharacterized protein n=1 Tax=Umezawaea endophytica TaxID=1654476 RepID=A0A9X2VMQ5_9PSEU|nr:hypothetical protein [Umezawaea endophytica]MCS7478058.1 hypothetical protein [Umezawaea endophytica]